MSRTRDQAVADTTQDQVDVVGRCRAEGCPNIWTTESSRLCRWHSAAHSHDWPQVTAELQREATDRAFDRSNAEPAPKVPLLHKREILGRLRRLFTRKPEDPKAWAWALRAREEAGELLPSASRAMWREALKTEIRGEKSLEESALSPDHQSRAGAERTA